MTKIQSKQGAKLFNFFIIRKSKDTQVETSVEIS